MEQGIIYDGQMRKVRLDEDRKPDAGILRAVQMYDSRLDLKWNNDQSRWELWRKSEIADIPVFVCPLGHRLDGTLMAKLREMDTRADGWEDSAYQRMQDGLRKMKREKEEFSEKAREWEAYINAPDEEMAGVKRAQEIIQRVNAGKD
jgi:hypothetical protein